MRHPSANAGSLLPFDPLTKGNVLQMSGSRCDNGLECGHGGFDPLGVFGDLGDLALSEGFGDLMPSCASCSRKSDQSSASDSFLLPLSGKKSVDNAGVLGVRCQGDSGTLRLGFEAPGRARPACSRWSAVVRTKTHQPWNLRCPYRLTMLAELQ